MDQKVQVQVSTSTVPLSTHELKLVQANYQGKVRIILAGNTMMNWHPVKVVSSNTPQASCYWNWNRLWEDGNCVS